VQCGDCAGLGTIKLSKQQLREKMMVAKPFPLIVQCDEKQVLTFELINDIPAFTVPVTASHSGAVNRLSTAVRIRNC